jgi:hypothetical protein
MVYVRLLPLTLLLAVAAEPAAMVNPDGSIVAPGRSPGLRASMGIGHKMGMVSADGSPVRAGQAPALPEPTRAPTHVPTSAPTEDGAADEKKMLARERAKANAQVAAAANDPAATAAALRHEMFAVVEARKAANGAAARHMPHPMLNADGSAKAAPLPMNNVEFKKRHEAFVAAAAEQKMHDKADAGATIAAGYPAAPSPARTMYRCDSTKALCVVDPSGWATKTYCAKMCHNHADDTTHKSADTKGSASVSAALPSDNARLEKDDDDELGNDDEIGNTALQTAPPLPAVKEETFKQFMIRDVPDNATPDEAAAMFAKYTGGFGGTAAPVLLQKAGGVPAAFGNRFTDDAVASMAEAHTAKLNSEAVLPTIADADEKSEVAEDRTTEDWEGNGTRTAPALAELATSAAPTTPSATDAGGNKSVVPIIRDFLCPNQFLPTKTNSITEVITGYNAAVLHRGRPTPSHIACCRGVEEFRSKDARQGCCLLDKVLGLMGSLTIKPN